jgi:hypothetical protein
MKKTYIILGVLVVGILIGTIVVMYEWNRKPRQVSETSAAYAVTTAELFTAFKADTAAAAAKYGDKVIQVSGKVDEAEEDAAGNISAVFHGEGIDLLGTFNKKENKTFTEVKSGNTITFKGEFIGCEMDEIFGIPIVKLDRCILVK